MSWDSIPNFGDKQSKINERIHADSGARIIEVLYGAHDSSGRPVSPENDNDGHGHWIALEIDGLYQMLSWRRPQSEGGRQEYGKSRSANALSDLEAAIKEKQRLCSQAESVASSNDWRQGSGKLSAIMSEWKKLFNWNTPKEKELWERFRSATDRYYNERGKERERNKYAKKSIISEASSIVYSTDWKQAGDRLKALFEKWKSIASAGKDNDDALWSEFNRVRQVFFDRQEKHYKEQSEQRDKNRRLKNDLISEARRLAQYSEKWKETGDALNTLMERWKSIGSAGHGYEDKLWSDFNAARQDFFNRRRRHYDELNQLYVNNAAAKSRIANEAQHIAQLRDYSSPRTERMKALDIEWKSIGSAGKDNEEGLWQIFREAKDSFWLGKRAEGECKQREFREKLYDAISRKRSQISNLESQISGLRDKMYGMKNQEYINNMCRWIDEKEAKICELQSAIYDMESKLRG
jgi:hypothetical protein